MRDFRYSIRTLINNPGFAVVVVLTLALGIGVNSTIFTFVNAILLQPLPYEHSERIVMVFATNPEKDAYREGASALDFLDWQKQSSVTEHMVAFSGNLWNLTGDGEPEMVHGFYLSGGACRLLGVTPMIGRCFSPEEERPGGEPVVLLLHSLWQRRYGGDPSVLGKRVLLHDQPYTVIGVMPPRFRFYNRQSEVLLPMAWDLSQSRSRAGRGLNVIARLKPGVTLEQAQAEMDVIARRLEQQYPDTNKGWGVEVVPFSKHAIGDVRPALLVLLGAVGFVLLIACANVTSLLLARAAARRKEMAVRNALGASWRHILRQVLAETSVVAGLGGLVGLFLAYGCVRFLNARLPDVASFGKWIVQLDYIGIDEWVLAFTVAVSLLTALIVGLVPAVQAVRPNLTESLKDTGPGSAGGFRGRKIHNMLVIGEVSLALLLVIGAGLMLQSLRRLQKVDPGFRKDNVLTMNVFLPWSRYRSQERVQAFHRDLFQGIERLPGVQSVAGTNTLPLSGFYRSLEFRVKELPMAARGEEPRAIYRTVTPNYFQTLGIPLVEGRYFTEFDTPESLRVVLIDKALADRYFPDDDPIGKHIVVGSREPVSYEIVGVVGSVRDDGLDAPPRPVLYWSNVQSPGTFMRLVIGAAADPMPLVPHIRSEVRNLDPDIPLYRIMTMEQIVAESTWHQRISVLALSSLAVLALFLAALGVYGVVHYSVTQQTREIGIRMALGADPYSVLRMAVGRGVKLALVGVVIGLAASLALTRVLSSQLYGIQATDLGTYSTVSLLLVVVAGVASFIPARPASKVDPVAALRYE